MKFIENPSLRRLSEDLAGITTTAYKIDARIEAWSCKSAGADKKLHKTIENQFQAEIAKSPTDSMEVMISDRNAEIEQIQMLGTSPFGPLVEPSSRRTFVYLISLLNAAFTDYDFSDVQPHQFNKELNIQVIMSSINSTLAGVMPGGSDEFCARLWNVLELEMCVTKECDVYSYIPDIDCDPFNEDGQVWSFNYFFFNKRLKRIVFFQTRAFNKMSNSIGGYEDDSEYVVDSYDLMMTIFSTKRHERSVSTIANTGALDMSDKNVPQQMLELDDEEGNDTSSVSSQDLDNNTSSEDLEESSEDEEQEEPKLKYQRLGSSVSDILRKDAASCMTVHSKFLALGTHWGVVYILDFNGNEIKRFASHSTTINELSVDTAGEYIASCSDDGRVVINSLYGTDTIEYEHQRPVYAIALDPDFSKKTTRSFAIGGKSGHLIMNSKGWFGRRDNNIHSGEGPIYSIKWCQSLIAWANDMGVKIFDCDSGQRITYIDRPKGSPRPDLYHCQLCWESPTSLLIGWADSVKIGSIKERSPAATTTGDPSSALPDRYVQITSMFQTDYNISGIAPFGEYLILLAYLDDEETDDRRGSRTQGLRPEFRIINRNNKEISSDALTIHGFEQYKANHYRLGFMSEESLFYVVSPRDIVVARPRDLDDHVAWLMERKRYEAALRVAEQSEALLRVHKLVDIGEKYIDELLTSNQSEKAAEMCTRILRKDPVLWSKWVYNFVRAGQLRAIVDYIPIGEIPSRFSGDSREISARPTLNETVYETILGTFLASSDPKDHGKFLSLIGEWPPNIYNPKTIIRPLKEKHTQSPVLLDALAKLYTYAKKYDKTLHILLQLKRPNAFETIEQYDLFDSIRDKVHLLMDYDPKRAVQMLVSHTERVPIAEVVDQLRGYPLMLHNYLHALFEKDPHIGQTYHEMQVALYAEYNYEFLMTFLKQSNYWALERAYQVCADKKYYPEMVYILGRMGKVKQALQLLIENIADVKKAIEFIEPQNDDELWEDLIDYSMKNPRFVSGLLEHIGAYVDPVRLIKRIPIGMEVIGLRDRIVKIISDYNLQMSLRCKRILKQDCVDLALKLNKQNRRPVRVEVEQKCAVCDDSIIGGNKDIVVFRCRHLYHQGCLRTTEGDVASISSHVRQSGLVGEVHCSICQAQTKRTKAASISRATRKIGPSVSNPGQPPR
ncbi:RING zinc finger-containing protein [Planoprotostelium fungivorum]|uniref:Vacuolar protein sorting-associated protein 41 homolog n=1 Tax=Planoprotostelium fungivorum TaxID=1890364 RepID=A0A2P6NGE3_9EUKA|nr:RING zinc finger-containing protein [Planoprotostelium fungivorum]